MRRRPHGRPGDHHRPRDRVTGQLIVRGDSAYGPRSDRCLPRHRRFLAGADPQHRGATAIEAIDDDAWTPVHYPGAVQDPDTGAWISDAEVAETAYTMTNPAPAASPPG